MRDVAREAARFLNNWKVNKYMNIPERRYEITKSIFIVSGRDIPTVKNGNAIIQGRWYEKKNNGYPKPLAKLAIHKGIICPSRKASL